MDQHTLSFAAYWRSALADAALGKGGLQKNDVVTFIERPLAELASGELAAECVERLFTDERDDVSYIEIVLRPRVFVQKMAHGQERAGGKPPYLLPVYGGALLSRAGRLYPSGKIVVPRDLLEPLERPAYAIGSVDALDEFLTRHPPPVIEQDDPERPADEPDYRKRWGAYLDYGERLVREVAAEWRPADDGYIDAGCWYVAKATAVRGAGVHILGLYDHLALARPVAPLLARYAAAERAAALPCLPANAALAARLGHASDAYPLARAQRDSLAHLLAGGDGDITCVNGPPGTGKTTLLLSVVATLWARAALAGGEPPVIIAASTNNQAVTNIIDAFGRDFAPGDGPLAGRWLPAIRSFGAYFPAQKKENEAAARYQTRAFFEAVEDGAYVAEAETAYLARARAAFPALAPSTVGAVVEHLRRGIEAAAGVLARVESGRAALDAARAAAVAALGDDTAQAMLALRGRHAACEAGLLAWRRAHERWADYLAGESIWLTLFAWLPAVARKRQRLALRFWQSLHPHDAPAPTWRQPEHAEAVLAERVADAVAEAGRLAADIARCEALLEAERRAAREWHAVAAALGVDGAATSSLDDCDRALDTGARFEMFRLAVHYWEGRWLQDMKPLLPELDKERKKTGRVAVEARWRRRMKLTPCAVSTFFMLPSMMKVARKDAGAFVPDYLYNFIDLLIVDEAGQALPEVAGASFALAKSALVIGDTMQIEPIWSNPRHVDVGNLIEHGLLDPAHPGPGYRLIADSGKAAASGSVMRIAQYASPYRYDADLSPGLYLYEHRRCYDPIIDYCNKLCYQGKLLPMRGAPPDDAPDLPPLGYLHIDGICQKSPGGSSFNALEARTIAEWLAANRQALEARYGKPLREVVGIVTPFSAQVAAIDKACRALSLMGADADEDLTIGTVHALQGAERAVIIFSPAYSKHLDGRFIDARASMLNVAVSRAKDSFLVFGDMDVLELSPPSSPRGVLAGYLFRRADNALRFAAAARADLAPAASPVTQLRDAAEHDAFLLEVLAGARREVRIVTPWIRARAVRRPQLWNALLGAVRRGVDVRIYTDEKFNTHAEDQHPSGAGESWHELLDALEREGMRAAVVGRVHSKIVAADQAVYCVGSFNWFSAARGGVHALHETSLVYRGTALRREIEAVFDSLERRIVRDRR